MWASPNGSFTATSSTLGLLAPGEHRPVNDRPIRPNPLIPTRTAIASPPVIRVRAGSDYSRAASAVASLRRIVPGPFARPRSAADRRRRPSSRTAVVVDGEAGAGS